jgi:hypothetical protein
MVLSVLTGHPDSQTRRALRALAAIVVGWHRPRHTSRRFRSLAPRLHGMDFPEFDARETVSRRVALAHVYSVLGSYGATLSSLGFIRNGEWWKLFHRELQSVDLVP